MENIKSAYREVFNFHVSHQLNGSQLITGNPADDVDQRYFSKMMDDAGKLSLSLTAFGKDLLMAAIDQLTAEYKREYMNKVLR